jgi:hypothetical protein
MHIDKNSIEQFLTNLGYKVTNGTPVTIHNSIAKKYN